MEFKSHLEIKSIDPGTGEFTGYLAVFGDVDSDSDVIRKGAFKVSLASKRLIPILWQHLIIEPIGVWTELREDDHGLFVKGKLAIDTDAGARAYSLLKMLMEAIQAKAFDPSGVFALSIGYKTIQFERVKGIRYLTEIKLFEGSFVTFSSNSQSNVIDVKAAGKTAEEKAALRVAEIKAMQNFKTALAAHELRKDLSNQRWMVDDAKDDSLDSIMGDATIDKTAKKAAARKTLHDAADAHADIVDQKIDAAPEVDPDEVNGGKDAGLTLEVKAQKKTMAAAIDAHLQGERKCMKAMDLMHQGSALHTKGIVLARQLSYAGIVSNDDKNALVEAGKAATLALEAAAKKVEEDAFVASLNFPRFKRAA